jgi:hypothetical protein
MSSPQPLQQPAAQAWYTYRFYTEALSDGQSIAVPFHTPVTAAFGGRVTRANYGATGGQVDVSMPDGSSYSYVHLDSIDPAVTPGATVTPGQFVGLSGGENAGYPGALHPASPKYSTAPHIDFDVWTAGAWNSTPQPAVAAQALKTFQSGGIVGGGPGSVGGGGGGGIGGIFVPAGPILPSAGTNDPLSAIANSIGQVLTFAKDWLFNPVRVAKLFVGIGLIFVALVLAFLPELAGAGAAALGAPELAPVAANVARGRPKQAIGGSLRAAGNELGSQTAADKEALKQQRAVANARTLEEERGYREATTRKLSYDRAVERAMSRSTATTSKLGDRQLARATGRNESGVRAEREGTAATRQRGTYEYSPRINSGKGGFGGYGVEIPKAPKAGRLGSLTRNAKTPKQPKQPKTVAEDASMLQAVSRSRGETIGQFLKLPVSERKQAITEYNEQTARMNRNFLRRWARRIAKTRPEGI